MHDFTIIQTGIFGSISNLNQEKQFQAGIQLLAFPLQNLNFYFASTLLSHNNGGVNNVIFEQMIGGKLFTPLWAEIKTTFGKLENYYDNQAFAVYNFAGEMKFKGSAKIIYIINPSWKITAEYLYISRNSNYIQYQENPENQLEPQPVTMTQDIQNQIILLGINWKF
jgi:hypothetical protein